MHTKKHIPTTGRFMAAALALALGMPMVACSQEAKSSAVEEQTATDSTSVQTPLPTAEIDDVTSVSYLGPAGTYTEEAAKIFFGDNDELLAQETVADALALVEEGKASYAIIPQENTIGGPVTDYIDALLDAKGVHVVGEVVLPIRQTLMGVPGTDLTKVKTVYSHKQGLAQSAAWLDENLPDTERIEAASTAAAAQSVAEGKDVSAVAIAAPGAAELYDLEVLQENVSQSDTNTTRFYVISQKENKLEGYNRAVFVANLDANELPGALAEACDGGTELVCVHDRPEKSALGTYRYVIELAREEGFTDEEVERLEGIDQLTYLGKYGCIDG